jgi:hypothetical protein
VPLVLDIHTLMPDELSISGNCHTDDDGSNWALTRHVSRQLVYAEDCDGHLCGGNRRVRRPYPHDVRPPQPLNGRIVKESQ